MMKKFLFAVTSSIILSSSLFSQDSNLDKKVRFGLRVTPQPTWFVTSDKNVSTSGAKFGLGFGLNMEFKLSDIAWLLTGLGGDFEGGKYQFKNDQSSNYRVMYLMNELNEFVNPNGSTEGVSNKIYKANTAYVLKERSIQTTYATIPFILKLSTKEIGALKYYGMFGCEIGIRLNAKATDTYFETGKFIPYNTDTLFKFTPSAGINSQSDIDIGKESPLIPMRFCFNAGLGAEYRLSGTTAAFVSVNYCRALSNQMKKESETTFYQTNNETGKSTFIKQNLKMSGIRISVGIMF